MSNEHESPEAYVDRKNAEAGTKYTSAIGSDRVHIQMGVPANDAPKPVAPIHRQGGITHRITVNPDGTTGPLEIGQATSAKAAAGTDPVKATAVGAQGQRINLSEASPDTIIDLGGSLGSTFASVWEQAGYVERDPSGRGYRVVGAQPNPSIPAPAQGQPEKQPKGPETAQPVQVDPADAVGVPPTTAASDAFQASMRETVSEQIIATLTKGQTPDFAEIGRLSGEGEDFAGKGEALHGELIASGQKVLANVGVENSAAFETWVLRERPEESNAAIRAMLNRDVAPLAALGREFQAARDARIEAIVEGNVKTSRIHGVLHVSREALGLSPTSGAGDFKTSWISVKSAIQEGHIQIDG